MLGGISFLEGPCGRQNNSPWEIPTFWSPSLKKYLTLYSKKDFAEVIKVKDLEMEGLPWIIQVGPM